MELTDEQQAVIDAKESLLKVNAVAGSGKTTTLLEFARARSDQKILYLAYNRTVADEVRARAKALQLEHLTVSTIHGLAYRYAHGASYELTHDISEWRLLDEYVPSRDRHGKRGLLYAWLLKDLINYYLNAQTTALDAGLLSHYEMVTSPAEQVQTLLIKHGEEAVEIVRGILSDMRQRRLPAVHDFYLKMFQFTKVRLPFEIILVDEAQDTSGVMLSIVSRQDHAQRLFVGDGFQQIYGFRYAVNSLDGIEGRAYWLNQTFRFGDELARYLSHRVNEAYELIGATPALKMRGTNVETRFGSKAVVPQRGPLTVIARSNLALFEAVLERLVSTSKPLYFEGGYHSYAFLNARVVGIFYLMQGQRARIQDPLIAKFGSFDEVRRYAKDTQNAGLSIMTDLVGRYGGKLFEFDRVIKGRLVDKDQARLIFTTTHKAKGQEYDTVEMVEGDFTTRRELARLLAADDGGINLERVREEINVYYVAATRAKKSIRLAPF